MSYINLNGKIIEAGAAGLPVDNRAFRYGHGLFETMLVQNGAIQLANYHWKRLMGSANALYFKLPKLLTQAVLEEEVLKTVRKNGLEPLCRVRLQLYAGTGG
ncbi:MAG: aminotransferase class IV, partial [Flavipsychrobacter sp.]